LVFVCSPQDEHGVTFHVYTDPATGDQWVRDADGDYHPNEGDTIDCPPVLTLGVGEFTYTEVGAFSFDDVADTALVTFTLPASAAALYQSASGMIFSATESILSGINGDLEITYSGTINDVLGSMWNLGFMKVEFNDKIGGLTTISWSTEFNSAYIENNLGHRNIVLIPTNSPND
jgi:hypothetical protein